MRLEPVQRRSLPDAVFEQLTAEIVAGSVPPGDALPAERALTEQLGVNRQAVREALQRMHSLGLVDILHGEPTRVRDFRSSASPELLTWLIVRADGSIDPAVVRSVFELRATVGADAARLCAARALPEIVDAIAAAVDGMGQAVRAGDDTELFRQSERFWSLVIDGADNVAYQLLLNVLERVYAPLSIEALAVLLGDELHDVASHRRLASAIAAGNERQAEVTARKVLARGASAVVATLSHPSSEGDR
ncbi:MAG: FadR family transcriptional regulator [Acidimicrobiia bacterium]|nr:FadR family transcriptional regulator [Acidimicrobiia bacterium]